jgi:histidyl-tRNA synthetase
VAQLGGRATPAVGFAMGLERLVLLAEEADSLPAHTAQVIDLFVAVGEGMEAEALTVTEALRERLPDLRILLNCGGGKLSTQLKRAYGSGATAALVLETGEQQMPEPPVLIKLRLLKEELPVQVLTMDELVPRLNGLFA